MKHIVQKDKLKLGDTVRIVKATELNLKTDPESDNKIIRHKLHYLGKNQTWVISEINLHILDHPGSRCIYGLKDCRYLWAEEELELVELELVELELVEST